MVPASLYSRRVCPLVFPWSFVKRVAEQMLIAFQAISVPAVCSIDVLVSSLAYLLDFSYPILGLRHSRQYRNKISVFLMQDQSSGTNQKSQQEERLVGRRHVFDLFSLNLFQGPKKTSPCCRARLGEQD